MANKPCMGMYRCPKCGKKIPVIWDGNHEISCPYCYQHFTVKRQKMWGVQHFERKDGGQDDV